MIEPGVNRALAVSRSKRIGVIGTAATIASDAYARALKAKERKVQIFSSICGMFVPLVEEGWCDGEIPLDIVRKYLAPIKQERIDALILACTHYPLLTSLIQEVVGPDITLVDSGEAAAKVVALELQKLNILAPEGTVAESHIYITDVAPSFYNMAHRILGDVLPTVTALTL